MTQNDIPREMTAKERREIRKLVTTLCANYDHEYGCLPLDSECYMFGKWYTGNFCKYFQNSVLPTNPELEASLMRKHATPCKMCGREFTPNGRQAYCSEKCRQSAKRMAVAARVRKHRQKQGPDVTK